MTLELPRDLQNQVEELAAQRGTDAQAIVIEKLRAGISLNTPATRATEILTEIRSGDFRRRNAAISRLARGDAQTRALVQAETEKSVAAYDGPDDDFADWHALDSKPYFPEEAPDYLDGLYRADQEQREAA